MQTTYHAPLRCIYIRVVEDIGKRLTSKALSCRLAAAFAHVFSGEDPQADDAVADAVRAKNPDYVPPKSKGKTPLVRAWRLWKLKAAEVCEVAEKNAAEQSTESVGMAKVHKLIKEQPTATERRAGARRALSERAAPQFYMPKTRRSSTSGRQLAPNAARAIIDGSDRAKIIADARNAADPPKFLQNLCFHEPACPRGACKKTVNFFACTEVQTKVSARQCAAAPEAPEVGDDDHIAEQRKKRASDLAAVEDRARHRLVIASTSMRRQRREATGTRWTQMQGSRIQRQQTPAQFQAERHRVKEQTPSDGHWKREPRPPPHPSNIGHSFPHARAVCSSDRAASRLTPAPPMGLPARPPAVRSTLHSITPPSVTRPAASPPPGGEAQRPSLPSGIQPPSPSRSPGRSRQPPPAPQQQPPALADGRPPPAPRRRTPAVDIARVYLREISKSSRRSTLTPDETEELCERLDDAGYPEYSAPEGAGALRCVDAQERREELLLEAVARRPPAASR